MNSVYIMSANRSAIGGFGGTLKSFCPVDLGTLVGKEAIARSGYDAEEVEHAVFGNVIHTEPRDMYVSRVIALQAGMSKESAALTVNRLCGSGLHFFSPVRSGAGPKNHPGRSCFRSVVSKTTRSLMLLRKRARRSEGDQMRQAQGSSRVFELSFQCANP